MGKPTLLRRRSHVDGRAMRLPDKPPKNMDHVKGCRNLLLFSVIIDANRLLFDGFLCGWEAGSDEAS